MASPGQTFGPYRVISLLGRGGMGEVYLAEDGRLHRRIALKVLPPSSVDDEASRRLLLREAQAAATLEHANICTVYDVGDADGQSFIAMQYVEGETLAARLSRRPLPLGDAVSIAAQVAAALTEAHRHGIVHRDIKPQNIMLSEGNHVTVLDFGLARVVAPSGTGEAASTALTASQTFAGTVPYMSPEQVRNDVLDARSDVFSFGTVLYEMLRAAHPFWSGSAGETMSAILTREPPALESIGPPELRRIVRKCLEKDRGRRYQSMHDLAIDLENVGRDLSSGAGVAPQAARAEAESGARRPVGRATMAVTGVAVLAIAVTAIGYARYGRRAANVPAGEFVQLTEFPDSVSAPSLSPDGRMVAFIRGGSWFLSSGQIFVKLLPNGDTTQLTHDGSVKYGPVFTADGSRVTYTAVNDTQESIGWDTWSVPVLGGEPTRLLPNASGLSWLDDRHVLFSEIQTGLHMGIATATLDRSSKRMVYLPAHERGMAHFARPSPDRKWVVVVEMDARGWQPCRVVPFDGSSQGTRVGPDAACTAAEWSRDGRTVYTNATTSDGTHLWRQRFPDGTPEPITSGSVSSEQGIALDPDGRSIVTSVGRAQRSLWLHDARGDRLLPLEGGVLAAVVSVDGTRAYCLVDGSAGIVTMDVGSGRIDRVLIEFRILDFDVHEGSRSVAFTIEDAKGQRQIWLASLDRRSPPRQIVANADSVHFAGAGKLLFRSLNNQRNFVEEIQIDGSGRRRAIDRPIVDLESASPDGTQVVVALPAIDRPVIETVLAPVFGGPTRPICATRCWARISADSRYIYVESVEPTAKHEGSDVYTLIIPLTSGHTLPDAPANQGEGATSWESLPGVTRIERGNIDPGPDPATYIFRKQEQISNLFRIPLR